MNIFLSKKKMADRIEELINENHKLKAQVAISDAKIAFFTERGDRYFASLDERNTESKETLQLAKEIMLKLVNKVTT